MQSREERNSRLGCGYGQGGIGKKDVTKREKREKRQETEKIRTRLAQIVQGATWMSTWYSCYAHTKQKRGLYIVECERGLFFYPRGDGKGGGPEGGETAREAEL